jgi:cytochrome b pre-mRNA-processing protein 3
MLGFLFRGLTAEPARAARLFDRLTAEARLRDWYVAGRIPDTFNGRFAVLATIVALALVRLEREGEPGNRTSVALTERFIEVMESEHRELGIGDPSLGKTVRKLVAMLARRTELWRSASNGSADWAAAARDSLYADQEMAPGAFDASLAMVSLLAGRMGRTPLTDLEQGSLV